jgi:hypothetical protein
MKKTDMQRCKESLYICFFIIQYVYEYYSASVSVMVKSSA